MVGRRPQQRLREDVLHAGEAYGADGEGTPERKYSPAECCGSFDTIISGKPDLTQICTSHVERQNLTMRTIMRRFTRLTNGFSKKVENHMYAVAIHYMHYTFGHVHKTLRVTPAMEARVSDHVWSLEEIGTLSD